MAGQEAREADVRSIPEGYLDIYKLAVEMADRVSGRRLTAGALPVSGALAALSAVHGVDRVLLASVGILLALSWWTLLRTYRRLAQAKFGLPVVTEQKRTLSPGVADLARPAKTPVTWTRPQSQTKQ